MNWKCLNLWRHWFWSLKELKSSDEITYSTYYSASKAQTIINESDIGYVFECAYVFISNIKESLGQGSSWIIDSVIDHTINFSKCKPSLRDSSYIKLLKQLNHPKKGFINIRNISDNEFFNWCLVRYLHSTDNNPAGIRKVGKDFARETDFKGLKLYKHKVVHKIEKKNQISISAFWLWKQGKTSNLCVKKSFFKYKLIYYW